MPSGSTPAANMPARRVKVMGILNVTPDSFSDGGRFTNEAAMASQVEAMVAAGADIIDVGGESSRPFSEPVPAEEELHRVLPAIRLIRKHHDTPISIDTTKAEVARRALDEGADIINDISALRFDPDMAVLARETSVPFVIMHMLGTPKTMQVDPVYDDVIADIRAFLKKRLNWAETQGIDCKRFIVDPGVGFGKTVAHNLTILKRLAEFRDLGCPILVGHSRKAFLGKILNLETPSERDAATAAVSAICALNGADIIRVHDVAATVQAVRLAEAVMTAP